MAEECKVTYDTAAIDTIFQQYLLFRFLFVCKLSKDG